MAREQDGTVLKYQRYYSIKETVKPSSGPFEEQRQRQRPSSSQRMIEPLRYSVEHVPTYEISRPVFCVQCLSAKATRNNPEIAVKWCQTCPDLLGVQKVIGAVTSSYTYLALHTLYTRYKGDWCGSMYQV